MGAAGRPGMGAGTGMALGAGGGLLGGMLLGDMMGHHAGGGARPMHAHLFLSSPFKGQRSMKAVCLSVTNVGVRGGALYSASGH